VHTSLETWLAEKARESIGEYTADELEAERGALFDRVCCQVCGGMAFLHSHRIIHRDLKVRRHSLPTRCCNSTAAPALSHLHATSKVSTAVHCSLAPHSTFNPAHSRALKHSPLTIQPTNHPRGPINAVLHRGPQLRATAARQHPSGQEGTPTVTYIYEY
jgi:hypothetical protein